MRIRSPRRSVAGVAAVAALIGARALPSHAVIGQPRLSHHVWYVDNTAAAGGDGSMVAPFDRLSRAAHAAEVGDTIYVFHGDGTDRGLDEGIRLRPYQRLVGSGVAFRPPEGDPLPAGEAPVISGHGDAAVTLADHASVEGMTLAGSGAAVVLVRRVADARLASLRVEGGRAAAAGVLLDGAQRATLQDVSVAAVVHDGVVVRGSDGVSLQGCHVERAGSGDDDAGLLVRDPVGGLALATSDLSAAAGAALRVEGAAGEAKLALQNVTLAADERAPRVRGLDLRLAGDAVLAMSATSLVLARPRGEGIAVAMDGTAKLRLELTGTRYADAQAVSTNALQVDVRGGAEATIVARSNDLRASDTVTLLSASGHGQIGGTLEGNTVGGNAPARGIVLLLGDRAESALSLVGNHVAGQRAEAFYGVVATQSRLFLDARDNTIEASSALTVAPLASFLLETRDGATACVDLRGNRFGDGSSGGPSLALRQGGDSSLVLAGFDAAAAEPAGQHLAAANRLGRIEIEMKPGRTLASAAAVQCPTNAALPTSAVASTQR